MSIRADVDRGLEIRAQVEKLERELKDIETRLKMHGLQNPGLQVDLKDADRDGKQYLAPGTARVVPVVFTADIIIGEFSAAAPRARMIRDAAKGKLDDFFKSVNKFENRFTSGKIFRLRAGELLAEAAPVFITTCLARDKQGIPKSQIKVEWDAAKEGK